MSDDKSFGINPLVLQRSTGKRFVEGVSGKGGLPSLVMWMDQLDFVKGIEPLLNSISYKIMFYDTALTKCAKEALKRPEFLREEEIGALLGYSCNKCEKTQSIMDHRGKWFCACGGRFTLTYLVIHKKLRAMNIIPTPEAVLMNVAYDGLADAYVEAFQAFRMVLSQISDRLGWAGAASFVDMELKDSLDSSFLYLSPGDTRISTEEKETMQFLVRGNIAIIDLPTAERLIRLGISAVKFGHLYNQLFCAGSDAQYSIARAEFSRLYNQVNEKIRLTTFVGRKDREKRTIEVLELVEKQYYPCSLLPDEFWQTGKLARDIVLKPLVEGKFPVFTDEETVAMNCFVAPSGAGKTTFMAATVAHAVDWAQEYVFNVLGDEKNGMTLAYLPMFPCEGHTGELLEILKSIGVPPHPIPCLNLVFLRPDEEITKDMCRAHPPTIYDRIVDIDNPFSFGFKFWTSGKTTVETKGVVGNRGVLNILKEFSLKLGKKHLCGIINARNLLRKEKAVSEKESKPDIQIATVLFDKFMSFRQGSKVPSARVMADEMSRLAPVQFSVAGTDTSKSSATVSEAIKGMRGINTSFDAGTQKWNEINPEAKAEAQNILFRNLSQSGDKSSSQRDIVLASLELVGEESEREQIAHMMETKAFPRNEHFWFWWNKDRSSVQVVRPNPPFFMLNQPKKTNLEVVKEYQKFSGDKILLDSWDEVPHLKYDKDEYGRKYQRNTAA